MQIKGKLTEVEMDDLRRLLRPKTYWPKLLLKNWYGLVLFIVVLWATVAGVISGAANLKAVAIIWAVIAAIIIWVIFSTKREMQKEFTQMNLRLPDWISFESDGVKLDGPDGANSFHPWRSFKGFKEGRAVTLLDKSRGDGFLILPTSKIADLQREELRMLLRSQVPQSI
jgi:hypothetical protein